MVATFGGNVCTTVRQVNRTEKYNSMLTGLELWSVDTIQTCTVLLMPLLLQWMWQSLIMHCPGCTATTCGSRHSTAECQHCPPKPLSSYTKLTVFRIKRKKKRYWQRECIKESSKQSCHSWASMQCNISFPFILAYLPFDNRVASWQNIFRPQS